MNSYSLKDAARILKVSPSRLRYWERTALVRPRDDAAGAQAARGGRYEFSDLVTVRGVLSLLDQGVPLRRIRKNVELLRDRLPELADPLGALRIWADGSSRIVIRHEGRLLEPDGQMVLDFEDEVGAGAIDAASSLELVTDITPDAQRELSAIELFEKGCDLDSEPSTYGEAEAAYREALELEPDFADCYCNLGAVQYNRGDRMKARRSFERCLEIEPEHVEGHFNLANLLEEEGCDEMALHHYRAALAADPSYPDLHINLALLHEKLGATSRASQHWRRYLQLSSEGAWADVARQRLDREDEVN